MSRSTNTPAPRGHTQGIAKGLGARLKQERRRLDLSQTAFGAVGGVKRIAQGLYEKESRHPTTDYLAKVADIGLDLNFLLFGTRSAHGLGHEVRQRLELRAFELVEECASHFPDGKPSASDRMQLYRGFLDHLVKSEIEGRPVESESAVKEVLLARARSKPAVGHK